MHPEIYIAKKTIEQIVRQNVSDTGQFVGAVWESANNLTAPRVTKNKKKKAEVDNES